MTKCPEKQTTCAVTIPGNGGTGFPSSGRCAFSIRTDHGTLSERAPLAYQTNGKERTVVPASFRKISESSFGFDVGTFDRSRELIIDPVLRYATSIAGSRPTDKINALAVNAAGCIYIAGYTDSTNFPTWNAPAEDHKYKGGGDAFVAKIIENGCSLLYCAYLGGDSFDEVTGIAVDSSGSAYVTGDTQSTNFPVVGGFQKSHAGNGGYDAFVVKLTPEFYTIIYSSYLGGSMNIVDKGYAIALDPAGAAVVGGVTWCSDFPLTNAYQSTLKGSLDGFIAKFSPAGTNLIFSTLLGGNGWDEIDALALDDSNNVCVAGKTKSTDLPTQHPFQSTFRGGWDMFISQLSPDGSNLLYSTYLGGTSNDYAHGIAADRFGMLHVAGETQSTNFPLVSPVQATYGGGLYDIVVAKLNPQTTNLVYSTYYGSNGNEYANAVAVDNIGATYVGGQYAGSAYPVGGHINNAGGDSNDAVLLKISGPMLTELTLHCSPASNVISWLAEEGGRYSLQYTRTLAPTQWVGTPGQTNLPGVPGTMSATDPDVTATTRFYRIMATELQLHCPPPRTGQPAFQSTKGPRSMPNIWRPKGLPPWLT